MRDSKEYLTATAGQWTGSLLCEHKFVVFVIVCGRQKEGGSCGFVVVVGLLGGGDTRGISVSLVETARKQQTGFTLKVRAARRGVLIEFTMNAKLFHRQCFKKHEIHLKLHCTCPALPLNT